MIHLALWILAAWFLLWFFLRIVLPFALACLAVPFIAWSRFVKKWWSLSTSARALWAGAALILWTLLAARLR